MAGEPIKLCMNCTWWRDSRECRLMDRCVYPYVNINLDLVRGDDITVFCTDSRNVRGACGPAGEFWRAKGRAA